LKNQLQSLSATHHQPKADPSSSAAALELHSRLAHTEALNEKYAAKLQLMQEEQLKKLEDFKGKYQVMQRELEDKQRVIENLQRALGSSITGASQASTTGA
jgi:predicted phage-related endonuclease